MPVRPSPSVRRAASVLMLLASEPARDFSLTEVARQLGLSKASCQSLLLALVSDGLVTRRERARSYQLGPSLVYLGDTARSALVAVDLATPELESLRNDLGITAVLGASTPSEMLITSVASADHPLGLTVVPGTRNPLRAPLGSIYVAWSSPAVVAAWFERGAAHGGADDRDRHLRGLAAIRARGYSATVRRFVPAPAGPAPDPALVLRPGRMQEIHDELVWDEVGDGHACPVLGMGAPVFGRTGDLVCVIGIANPPHELTLPEVEAIGDRLRAASRRLMAAVGGRPPSTTDHA
jgi:DNA-binding IclR family transcriptional regulator